MSLKKTPYATKRKKQKLVAMLSLNVIKEGRDACEALMGLDNSFMNGVNLYIYIHI